MSGVCNVITYHYVRDAISSRFPKIKAISKSEFEFQLTLFGKRFKFVTGASILNAIHGELALTNESIFLTFDDGYLDHFTNVFPLLDSCGIQAAFFVPVQPIRDRIVLDVNKIHFLLAANNVNFLKYEIFEELNRLRSDGHDIEPNGDLYQRLAVPGKYDDSDTNFIKKLLQRELSFPVRSKVTSNLFCRLITDNEVAFANELYVSIDQLKTMSQHGMTIGVHGYSHLWMDTLSREEQQREIELSLEFLEEIGVGTQDWLIAYPYGGQNESLRQVCAELNCGAGFTTRRGIVDFDLDDHLQLPRLDTNDFPKSHDLN